MYWPEGNMVAVTAGISAARAGNASNTEKAEMASALAAGEASEQLMFMGTPSYGTEATVH